MHHNLLKIFNKFLAILRRALVLLLLSPILKRSGYGMNFRDAVLITWGGLRGAVCLNLALLIALERPRYGNKVFKFILFTLWL